MWKLHVSRKVGTYPQNYMASLFYPEDGGSIFLHIFSGYTPVYMRAHGSIVG
jgi:hypothetical protein